MTTTRPRPRPTRPLPAGKAVARCPQCRAVARATGTGAPVTIPHVDGCHEAHR